MNAKAQGAAKKSGRFPILDALRIVLAWSVTYDHLGVFPLFGAVDKGAGLIHILARGWRTLVWGPPAVIGFFVISGFCIHLPFCREERLDVGRYYARRYLRILVPVAAAVWINRAVGNHQAIFGTDSVLWHSVLWSLICEELYYAVYPAVRLVQRRFGWFALLAPVFLTGTITSLLYPNCLDGSILGVFKTSVVYFPIWLLGCLLAEQSGRLAAIDSPWIIWKWRCLAWFGSWVCEMLHFHGKLSRETVLLAFGLLAYFWIRQEVAYGLRARPSALLAWGGLWSYSLYLMHGPASEIVGKLPVPDFGLYANWFVFYGLVLGISYLFYCCVERPSHQFARKIRLTSASSAARPVPVGDASAVLADAFTSTGDGLG